MMFIITLPLTTHEVPLDLPQGTGAPVERTTHRLAIAAAGAVTLDGTVVAAAVLPARLGAIGREGNAPLVMKTDPEARDESFWT